MKIQDITFTLWQSSATRNTYKAAVNGKSFTGISHKQLAFKLSKAFGCNYTQTLSDLRSVSWKRDNSKDWYLRNKKREDAKLDRWEDTRSFA
jgi:hypothetical protein